jgi:hypothetical protein
MTGTRRWRVTEQGFMKKFKIAFWAVLVILVGLIVLQNKAFFFGEQAFHINFWVARYETPKLPIWAVFVGFFVLGWVIAYVGATFGRLKRSRTLRDQNNMIATQHQELSSLKGEIEKLKAAQAAARNPETAEPADEQQVS